MRVFVDVCEEAGVGLPPKTARAKENSHSSRTHAAGACLFQRHFGCPVVRD